MNFTALPAFIFLQASPAAESTSFWDTLVHTNIFNIAIAFVALVVIVGKLNVGKLLDNRQEQIVQSLKEAEAKRALALSELADIEKRSKDLANEVDSLLKDAEQTAENVAKSIIQSAEEEAKRLLEQAKKRIEVDQKSAARDLEQRLMIEAIHGAQQLLESTLSDDDRHRSVEDFVAALPELAKQEASR